MAISDYLSNMFLGTAYGDDKGENNSNKGMEELWKIYRQAYNVKPVWNGKEWVMPKGAIQRFQMLLPLIQAQMRAGGQGQGKQAEGNYGLAGYLTQGLGKSLYTGLGKKIGGWDNVIDKLGGGIKDLWGGASDKFNYSTDYNYDPQAASEFDSAFSTEPAMEINMPTVAPEDIGGDLTGLGGADYSFLDNIDFTDYTDYTDLADVGYW